MSASSVPSPPTAPASGAGLDALAAARQRTLALVAALPEGDLDRQFSTLMSPIAWDLGHIAAFEDLWLAHRGAGEPLLRDDLMDVYDAFETPRAGRADLPFLHAVDAREYLDAVRERSSRAIADGRVDGFLVELVVRHEHQHCETVLQTLDLARLERYAPVRRPPAPGRAGRATGDGLDLVPVDGGPCSLGAPDDAFAYDNERPRHMVDVPAFEIGRTPVTNAAFARFVEAGGYERREHWSDAGWAWRSEHELARPRDWDADGREWRIGDGWQPLDPAAPVVHVSWHEADAFARAHGLRLPTEAEWEKAATWDAAAGAARPQPWGAATPSPEVANVDQLAFGTDPAGTRPSGASPCGALDMLGNVWEWTESDFGGYPGFVAHPYREYSEVFFGPTYKVLRGASWATAARVATPTFRNWDLPERRQIFAGIRVAS